MDTSIIVGYEIDGFRKRINLLIEIFSAKRQSLEISDIARKELLADL